MIINIKKGEGMKEANLNNEIKLKITSELKKTFEFFDELSKRAYEEELGKKNIKGELIVPRYTHKTYCLEFDSFDLLEITIYLFVLNLKKNLEEEAKELNIVEAKILWRRLPEIEKTNDTYHLICRCCVVPNNFKLIS